MYQDSGLDVFISASLKYPELSAVRYEADQEQLIFEAALQGDLSPEKQASFEQQIIAAVKLFHSFKGTEPRWISLEFRNYAPGLILLRYHRDSHSICEEETELFIDLLAAAFKNQVYKDCATMEVEESVKRKVKRNLIQKISRENVETNRFLSYREGGRVLVFNK
ncbi:MAG: hypothetical protein ACOX0F_10040 [Syntrophomonadaceae bacterium]